MLEAAILPQFNFIEDRKGIFSSQDFDFTQVPVMWIAWGTEGGNSFSKQRAPASPLVRSQFGV